MLKKVTVTNYIGESITMDLFNPSKSGFNIKSIDGLGPGKATINTKPLSIVDGSIYNSSKVESRNIVLNLGFDGNDIESIRHKSYKFFPIKSEVTLKIETDERFLNIKGHVESNEPNIFSDKEDTNISIICPDPWFWADSELRFDFAQATALFEFPFSNESLIDRLIIFGLIEDVTTKSVNYIGDVPTGVVGELQFKGPAENIHVYNIDSQNGIHINTTKVTAIMNGVALKNQDSIFFSTVDGDKYCVLLREGVYYNILNAVDQNSVWFKLRKGDNRVAYAAEKGQDNMNMVLEARILFEGA